MVRDLINLSSYVLSWFMISLYWYIDDIKRMNKLQLNITKKTKAKP